MIKKIISAFIGVTIAAELAIAYHPDPLVTIFGGTGQTSFTSGAALIGNGTSAISSVLPGPNGYVMVSNGTTWASSVSITASGGGFVYPSAGSTYGGLNTPIPPITGYGVTAIGQGAGDAETSGAYNTYYGNSAGSSVTTASGVTAIGYLAGSNAAYNGPNIILMGSGANLASGTDFNSVVIGNNPLWNSSSGTVTNFTGVGMNLGLGPATSATGNGAMNGTALGYGATVQNGPTYFGSTAIGYKTNAYNGGVAVGPNATAGSNGNQGTVAIGSAANATGVDAIAIGAGVTTAAGTYAISMGTTTTAAGLRSIAMGWNNAAPGQSQISIGSGVVPTSAVAGLYIGSASGSFTPNTTGNQITFGSPVLPLNDMFIGQAAKGTLTPSGVSIQASPAAAGIAVDTAGGSLSLRSGTGTGAGGGGALIFQTSPVMTSGTNADTLVTAMQISASGAIAIGPASPTPAVQHSINTTTTANTSCGTLAGSAGCVQITVNGVTHFIPYY